MSDLKQDEMKYKAFISYSHQDRKWGDWLHKALETYRIPKELLGRETDQGKVPARLYPVFRDREELPTATELGPVINQALEQSSHLIVICSPRSAKSQWVHEEILQFKRQGKADQILCLIIDGEPNATDKPDLGQEECFPEAVKYKLDEDGELAKQRTEPIAADTREGKDGKQNALLKLVAGLLGVGFDDLKQREARRRQKRLAAVAGISMVLMVAMAALTGWALIQRSEAITQRSKAEKNRREALVNFKQAHSAVDTALTGISEILGDYPGLQQARIRLLQRVADHYLKFALQRSEDLEIQIESGRAFLRLGEVRQELYEMETADDSFRQGEARFRKMRKNHPENVTIALELAACLSKRAILNDILGDYDDAQEFYDEVILLLRTLASQSDQQEASRKALAAALSNLANMQLVLDRLKSAEAASLESSAIYESLSRQYPGEPNYAVGVAQQHYNLGLIKNQTNRVARAGTDFQRAIDIFTRLLNGQPANSRYLQSRAALSNALALAMRTQGKFKAEQAAYQLAEQDYAILIESRPDDPSFRKNLALTQTNRAQTLNRTGRSGEAVELLLPAYRILDALFEQFVDVPEYGEQLGICCDGLTHAHMLSDDALQAKRFSGLAITRFQELADINPAIGRYRQRLAMAQAHAAQLIFRAKDHKKALKQLGRAIQSMKTLVTEFPGMGGYRNSLAQLLAARVRILVESGQQEMATAARQETVAAWEAAIKLEQNPLYHYELARFQTEALSQLEEQETAMLVAAAKVSAEGTPFSADSQNLLALAKVLEGSADDAQQALDQAKKLRPRPHADDSLVEALVLAAKGRGDPAKESIQEARQWLVRQQPGNHRLRDFIAEVERYLAQPR